MKQVKYLIIITLYVATVAFWFALLFVSRYFLIEDKTLNFLRLLTQIPLAIIPITGGILGLENAFNWNGFKSFTGRAVLFLSLGLILWGCGMIVWNYYIFFTHTEIPYPSFADIGYSFGLVFLTMGILQLSQVVGIKFGLQTKTSKVFLLIIPLIVILGSIYLLVYVARGGILIDASENYLKLFFDLLYPLGDVVNLTLIILIYVLSFKFLGGKYKMPVLLLLFGIVVFYIADFTFSYTTTMDTYYNGYYPDFLFTTAMFILSLGVAGFVLPNRKNLKFSILKFDNLGGNTIFHQILIRIIKKQEFIIGASAWQEANEVVGLAVDKDNNMVSYSGDWKMVVDRLVAHYEKFFGKTSRAVCKEAVRDLIVRMPQNQIPDSLK